MKAVFLKEIKQYIVTPVGAVFVAAYFVFTGYYFVVGLLLPAQCDVSGLFNNMFSMLMVLIPLLTMRSFAEERRLKTDQLLLTSPESFVHIFLGKFSSAYCIFLVGSLSFVPALLVLARFNALDLLETVGNIVALLLVGGVFIAIGLFTSSVTENQIVAAVMSYVITLGLWLLDYLRYYFDNSFLSAIISYLSFRTHFSILESGVFQLSTVVYFLSVMALMLTLTCIIVEHRRTK